jgi:hypothetical protein
MGRFRRGYHTASINYFDAGKNKALKLLIENEVDQCERETQLYPTGAVWRFPMAQNSTNETQKAHALIEMLPPAQLTAVVTLLEAILDPVAKSIASAPVEDEEITEETATAIERGRSSLAAGKGIPHEEVLREFGLKK